MNQSRTQNNIITTIVIILFTVEPALQPQSLIRTTHPL
jgi:hypothetical protein